MRPILLLFLYTVTSTAAAQDSSPSLRKDIEAIRGLGMGSPEGRKAWERLARSGAMAIPALLEAMDTPNVVEANWFFTALNRIIVAVEGKLDGRSVDAIFAFANDPKRQGRARRVAMELVEKQKPGTLAHQLPGWMNDPEFRPDAIDQALEEARRLAKIGKKEEALTRFQTAFDHSQDVDQARFAALGLLDLGREVSVARHLGFLTDWYLVGPFDAKGNPGFKLNFPPEIQVKLDATYMDKDRKLAWKRYSVKEPSPRTGAKHVALVNLRESRALGDADDAVAYAYTVFTLPKATKAEFRGAADDNFTVWVNGLRVFGFEEYRNGIRFDRHRFNADLREGKNSVLVKVVQTPAPNPEPNWEFILRVVDEKGRGLDFKHSLR